MTKRILSLILAVLMLLPMAVSCAETQDVEETTAPGVSTEAPADVVDTTPVDTELHSATLPEGLNFGGETVTFISRDNTFVDDEISVDDQNGAMVNDAIYKRKRKGNAGSRR